MTTNCNAWSWTKKITAIKYFIGHSTNLSMSYGLEKYFASILNFLILTICPREYNFTQEIYNEALRSKGAWCLHLTLKRVRDRSKTERIDGKANGAKCKKLWILTKDI